MASALKIKVLLVDDHALVREGIRSSLTRHPRIRIVGEAQNGKDAVRRARELKPDIVLMDINMPVMSGLDATPLLKKDAPRSRVIALTVHANREYVAQILRSGASGYVLKDTTPEELVRAIEAVHKGEAFFSPGISQFLLQSFVQGEASVSSPCAKGLSKRELEILQAIARGDTSKEIGVRLGLSTRTVETYRVRVKRKLKARNTAQLLSRASEQGFL